MKNILEAQNPTNLQTLPLTENFQQTFDNIQKTYPEGIYPETFENPYRSPQSVRALKILHVQKPPQRDWFQAQFWYQLYVVRLKKLNLPGLFTLTAMLRSDQHHKELKIRIWTDCSDPALLVYPSSPKSGPQH